MDQSTFSTMAGILAAMAAIALVESAIPLRRLGGARRAHLVPNLTFTAITFATNALFGGALIAALAPLVAGGHGLLPALGLPPLATTALTLAILDFSFYVAHVSMHHVPWLWRFHRVHHADPAVDVTTTARQHPGEGVIRYAFLALFALPLGVTPADFAIYRAAVAFAGLLEHANVRAPAWLDRALASLLTWPSLHKIHHARDARFTDSNYGNLLNVWDRIFGTFTPLAHLPAVVYGLADGDAPSLQTTAALFVAPFRSEPRTTSLKRPARAR